MMGQEDQRNNLILAFQQRFSPSEATRLADLMLLALRRESLSYSEIEIEPDLKDDLILLAYEERLLLPMKSIIGSAWCDRVLTFMEPERYHMPRVVHFLVSWAGKMGEWNPDKATSTALEEAGESNVKEIVTYLNKLKERTTNFELEVGMMQLVSAELGIQMDMHDMLDRCVRAGIMSPITQRSLHTGLVRYELNPSLCWRSI